MAAPVVEEKVRDHPRTDEHFDLAVGELEWDVQDAHETHKMVTTLDTCWNPTTCSVSMYCC